MPEGATLNRPSAATASGLLFLHAATSLHMGAGAALGAIDLPIARERHTRWPFVPGSGLKGSLREGAREAALVKYGLASLDKADDHADVTRVYGPTRENAAKHAGALAVGDARLLAFPVRSLRGLFAWTTCPGVIERLGRDARLAGVDAPPPLDEMPGADDALVGEEPACPCVIPAANGAGTVLLEDQDCRARPLAAVSKLAEWIAERAFPEDPIFKPVNERLRAALIVLHDDLFTYLAEHATEVATRIALDPTTKTVKQKALFTEERLPPETILYSLLSASSASGAIGTVEEMLRGRMYIQLGGDETTGKGICAARLVRAGGAR